MPIIQPGNGVEWTCSYNTDGSANGTLKYMSPFYVGTEIILQDNDGVTFYKGYVVTVSMTENEIGYTMELADPLSSEYKNAPVVFENAPSGFPNLNLPGPPINIPGHAPIATSRGKQDIDDYCDNYGLFYFYKPSGTYRLYSAEDFPLAGSVTITDDIIVSLKLTEGLMNPNFGNCFVVKGFADKDIAGVYLCDQVVIINGIKFEFCHTGNRSIKKITTDMNTSPYTVTTETWDWSTSGNNVCSEYKRVEEIPIVFGGVSRTNRTTTTTTATANADVSAYSIDTVTVVEEWNFFLGADAGSQNPQYYEHRLWPVKEIKTSLWRDADGRGERKTKVREIPGKTKFLNIDEATGNVIPISAFKWYELLPESEETTVFLKRNDKTYHATFSKVARLQIDSIGSWPPIYNFSIRMVPSSSSFGYESPPLPIMEEAVDTISATVEWLAWIDELSISQIGLYYKTFNLPYIDVPSSIDSSSALQTWLLNRAKDFAHKLKWRGAVLLDEAQISMILNAGVEQGKTFNRNGLFTIMSVTHTCSSNNLITSFVANRPSSETMPVKRLSSTVMKEIVELMKKYDKQYDNVQTGSVVKPVSNTRAMVEINNEKFIVDNPNGGPVYQGDVLPCYRQTGANVAGRVF